MHNRLLKVFIQLIQNFTNTKSSKIPNDLVPGTTK